MPLSFRLQRLVPIALSATLAVCGGSSPTAAPTPNPNPTTNPTPVPAPTPLPPLSAACSRLGPGSQTTKCPAQQPTFLGEVDGAIAAVRGQRPDLFGGGDKVTSTGEFIIAVIKNLDAVGLCAGWDGEELAVKNTDAFNDQYDILTANNVVRYGKGAYRTTCYPAAFPLDGRQPQPTPGCNLPPSTELTCGRETGRFYADVEAAIDRVLADKPQIFDFTDVPKGTNWPKILDQDAYLAGVIGFLTAKGYCARWDGRELQLKNTSNYNEQYAIILSFIWIRRGEGIYRSTCWPSAF
jgi:hypothetical protein